MPPELAGFYWDEVRNRYFPLSSRPKTHPATASTVEGVTLEVQPAKKTRTQKRNLYYVPWHTSLARESTISYVQGFRHTHDILRFHYECTSRVTTERLPTIGSIQAFCNAHVGEAVWRFVGDNQGWLYSDKHTGSTEHGVSYWSADLNLQPSSPISSIRTSGSYCVTTSLGPGKISVQDMSTPDRIFLLNLSGIYDIWTSELQGPALVLGASRKAVYISDINFSRSLEYLPTGSDVFAVARQETLVYAGTRNGSVERFDLRMPKRRSQKLFDSRFQGNSRSSVLHLGIIGDHELLMSHLNGDLMTFDLRFGLTSSQSSPLKVFHGHVNTHTRNLGIVVDQSNDFLFAAGQDLRIRGWSLRTGAQLIPPESSDDTQEQANPFQATFAGPVCALQVIQEVGTSGMSLWAASGHDLYQFHLGQHAIQ
ncbi:hypothetical protein CPB84DRAFT_1793635 [Gymnopilus junonius]|uniref:Uncharacterized protein n=1 Tax=Gymnopilus junonius TaxID=109634 RepID=A0A9P5NBP5_GYMJU|nr:hypothetical protein CPB84DRAFT_1793635 [Gymnopilus junonius]